MPRGVASDSCSSTYAVRVRTHGRRRQPRRQTTVHDKRPVNSRTAGVVRSSGSSISEAQRDSRVQRSSMPDAHTCWKLWKPACIKWKSRTRSNILDLSGTHEHSGPQRNRRDEQRQSRRKGSMQAASWGHSKKQQQQTETHERLIKDQNASSSPKYPSYLLYKVAP